MRNLAVSSCYHIGIAILVSIVNATGNEQYIDIPRYDRFTDRTEEKPPSIDDDQQRYPETDNAPKQYLYEYDADDGQNQLSKYIPVKPDELRDFGTKSYTSRINRMPSFILKNNMYKVASWNDVAPTQIRGGRRKSMQKSSHGSHADDDDDDNQFDDLKQQIRKTTSEINALYNAYEGKNNMLLRNKTLENILVHKNKAQLVRKLEISLNNIQLLKDRLKTEKEVRYQMIRHLARARLKNTIKTRTLQSLILYYKPSYDTLSHITTDSTQRRAILNAKIMMLPKERRLEYEKRINWIKKAKEEKSSETSKT